MRKANLKGRLSRRRADRRPPSAATCSTPEHKRFALALEAARFGVWDWDLRSGSVQCSGKVEEIFGFPVGMCPTAEDILSRIHPDDRERAKSPAESGPFRIEYRVVLADGRMRWVSSRGLIYCDESGRPVRRVAALFDVTPLKEATEEAVELKDRLERRVARRTALLEDLARQLEAFSFSVSHDIRAPLRAMLNYADLAKRGCLGKVDRQTLGYLEKIACAAMRLDKLTHDLLRFTRLSKAPPSTSTVSLSALVAELLEEYPALEATRAFFQINEVRGQVFGNESLLRQALSSILENAVKFRDPARPLAVRVWTEEQEASVRLLVRDNGIGIESRYHSRIFLPFERLRPGESGTGMGLTLTKRAVELMGGRVGFTSSPGQGTTFWVELPKA